MARAEAISQAAGVIGCDGEACRQALGILWQQAFQEGRLAALDELQDRFCVCMK